MSDTETKIEVPDANNGLSSKRVRRTVERLSEVYDRAFDASKEKKVAKVEGEGVPLWEIARVKDAFQRARISQDMAKEIHHLCYKSIGRSSSRKGDIRRFSGFGGEDGGEEALKRVAVAEKMRLDRLKVVCDLFAVPTVARSKREMCEALVAFLRSPREIEDKSFRTAVLRGTRRVSAKGQTKVARGVAAVARGGRGGASVSVEEDESEGEERKVVRRKRKIIEDGDDQGGEAAKRRKVVEVGGGDLESVSSLSEEGIDQGEEEKIDQEEEGIDQETIDKKEKIDENENKIDMKMKKIDQGDKEIDKKEEKVDQKVEIINQKEKKKKIDKKEKIDDNEKKIDQKGNKIDLKRKKIDKKEKKVDKKEEKIDKKEKKIDKKEKKVTKVDPKAKRPRKAPGTVLEGEVSSLSSLSSIEDADERREAVDEAEVERRVREVLAGADPHRTTLNQVCEAVAGLVPGLDLLEGRPRLKAIIRAVIDGGP